jgi:hypothetical protein
MTDAPDKIWAWSTTNCNGDWTIAEGQGIEYTRTDISQARIAELEAALVYYRDEYCEHGGDLCGRLSSDACGGCNAATALKAKP